MKDAPITTCPDCTGTVKRLLYPVGIVFKGSGWYINDSRKPEPSEKSDSAAATDSASDGKSSETKSEGDAKSPAPAEAKTESKAEKVAAPGGTS